MEEIDFTHSKFFNIAKENVYDTILSRNKTIKIVAIAAVIITAFSSLLFPQVFLACLVFIVLAGWLSNVLQQSNLREVLNVTAQDCDPEKAAYVWNQFSESSKKKSVQDAYGILQASNLATAGCFDEAIEKLDSIDFDTATPQNQFAMLTARFNSTLYTKGWKASLPALKEVSSFKMEDKKAKGQNAQLGVMTANCTARCALKKRDIEMAEKQIGIFEKHVTTPAAFTSLQTMYGMLEELRGNIPEAKEYFKKAVEHGGTMYDKKMAEKRLAALGDVEEPVAAEVVEDEDMAEEPIVETAENSDMVDVVEEVKADVEEPAETNDAPEETIVEENEKNSEEAAE